MKKSRSASLPSHPAPIANVPGSALRLGLCCQFVREPIAFRTTTAAAMLRLRPAERLKRLSELCLANAESLETAIRYCAAHGIGCFRITSTLLPLKTHPEMGYTVESLPEATTIVASLRRCGTIATELGIRTTFHPSQYVVLNSPRNEVVEKSVEDLEYHAEVASWVGADVVNIHGGGAYGDKAVALERFARHVEQLPHRIRSRLTVENDDKVYTPADLLPICQQLGLPLVYDVHHHRCLPDRLSIEEATAAALDTWDREPLLHISSPLAGWAGNKPERHHDEINIDDFPPHWMNLPVTVEVEAKAKELAVSKLREQLIIRSQLAANAPAGKLRPSPKSGRLLAVKDA